MAIIRVGTQPALMVVDFQVGVVAGCWQAEQVTSRIARAVQRARDEGVPVIWVQHTDEDLRVDSAAWQWVPELVPAAGECRIHKEFNSAFEHTALDAELARLGITHIVLCGAASNWCIRATAYAALERGYDLTLLADAHTTKTRVLEDGSRIEAEPIVRDLNLTLSGLSYPGRTTGTASADRACFGQPKAGPG